MSLTPIKKAAAPAQITFRKPVSEDGAAVNALIRECKPLDENSLYCNLLQCDHFADTCILAERGGEILGWISGYLPPAEPGAFFVWQVAVSPKGRGLGLARKMLDKLMARDECAEVDTLLTTITADNDASWGLFRSFARRMDAPVEAEAHYERDAHFDGAHATEHLARIGPFGALAQDAAA